MLAAHHVLARMPIPLQRAVLNGIMRLGAATKFGLFRMFVRTLVEIGAEPAELDEALRDCRDVGRSFVDVFRKLAERLRLRAAETANPQEHYRAALYALLADWASSEPEERRRNYALAIPEFEAFAHAHVPRIERVIVPYRELGLAAYYVAPERPPAAAIVLVPGNDEPKEWMVPIARAACSRRLAALAIDLPGYGENHLRGTRLDGREALRDSARGALDFLSSRGPVPRPCLPRAEDPRLGRETSFAMDWLAARLDA